jgi:ECF sigma factor
MKDVTTLLQSIKDGDPHAASELLPLLFDELSADEPA